jgi:hypothetical protein
MPTKGGRRRKRGGNLKNVLSSLHDTARKSQAISRALNEGGYNRGAKLANMLGYGKKGGFGLGSIGKILGNITRIPAMGIIGATSGLQSGISQLGTGRRGGAAMTGQKLAVVRLR